MNALLDDAAAVATARPYALGHTSAEHERLIKQARLVDPHLERLLRDAGVAAGDRVLDVGSGLGDVALVAARLVGPSGAVVGIDRDAAGLARARERAAAVGWRNVEFRVADVHAATFEAPFDVILGRFVLIFQPDPLAVMRHLAQWLRPGGLMVFQEPCWSIVRPLLAPMPLRSACVATIQAALRKAGMHADMELVLYRAFQALAFERSNVRLEVPCATDAGARTLLYDFLCSVMPRIADAELSLAELEPLATLAARLVAEVDAAGSFTPIMGLAGAWARKP